MADFMNNKPGPSHLQGNMDNFKSLDFLTEDRQESGEMEGNLKDKTNVDGDIENDNGKESKIQKMKRLKQQTKFQREYKKEATLIINLDTLQKVTAMDLIKAIEERIGFGKLIGLRQRPVNEYELTLENEELCEEMSEGIMINGHLCEVRRLCVTERMVSFLRLPTYISDEEILMKLTNWGVTPILPLRRRFYPGTTVADGTRFIRVKFPKDIASLPYSTKFETEDGPQYCRVIHDSS